VLDPGGVVTQVSQNARSLHPLFTFQHHHLGMAPERALGAAATRWSDYIGTAAADGADAVLGRPSLYELAGLDRDRWLITALDIEVVNGQLSAVVYAFDRSTDASDQPPDVGAVIAAHGHLPVRAFPLGEGTQIQALLDQVFQRVAIRLVAREFSEDTLAVQADIEQ
jgi:hypothetical protein